MIQTSNQLDERHPNLSKDQIFVEANLWMIDIFNDAESVIQYSDKEAGVLKGRYVWFYQAPSQYTSEYKFTSTITLYIKDKNIRMSVQNEPYPSSINMGLTNMETIYNEKIGALRKSFYNKFE